MRPKKVILCIDDNEQSLSIRKFMLETRGYRVLAATNGPDAIETFQQTPADLVIADLMMPGMDGAEVIRVLKEMSSDTPMILISGKVTIYDKGTVADLFLPKGAYPPAELLDRIRIMLVKKRGPKRTSAAPIPIVASPAAQIGAS